MDTTSTVPAWLKEFDERVENFSKTINVDSFKVREILTQLGVDGKTEQSLTILESNEYLPLSDLFKSFVDNGLTQIAKVRLGASCLRGANSGVATNDLGSLAQSIETLANANRPKNTWTDEELLAHYDDNEVWEILRKRSHGRHCIIFNADNTVNVQHSLSLLIIAKKQPTSDRHIINGKPVRVYRAGEMPLQLIDESPFFRGVALVNGVCGQSATDWTDIPWNVRVMARIHVFNVETVELSKTALRQIWEDARKGIDTMIEKYPDAACIYDDLCMKGDLPKLKISSNDAKQQASNNKRDSGF